MPERLGLITIGQSPRPDLIADVTDLLAAVNWTERGALDGVDPADLVPTPGEDTLITRLRTGETVRVAAQRIGPLVTDAAASCAAAGCDRALLLCTGRVIVKAPPIPVLHAEQVAHQRVADHLGPRTLGVVCPLPEQQLDMATRWQRRLGRPVRFAVASPYSGTADDLAGAGQALAHEGAEVIVLDCMGYTREQARVVADAAGVVTHAARVLAFESVLGVPVAGVGSAQASASAG